AWVFFARLLGFFRGGGENFLGLLLFALASKSFGQIVPCDRVVRTHLQYLPEYCLGLRVLALARIDLRQIAKHARAGATGSERSLVKDFIRDPIAAPQHAAHT